MGEWRGHPRLLVFAGITHYQKPLWRGFEYLQKEKEAGEMWTQWRFFGFWLGSLHNWKQPGPLPFPWPPPSPEQHAHIRYESLGEGLVDVLGRAGGSADTGGAARWTPAHWVFRMEKSNWLMGTQRKGKGKNIHLFYFDFSNWENILLGGRCLPRTSNSVCSTRFIFKPKCRFYSWNVIGLVWAETGKFFSEALYVTTWKRPSRTLQVEVTGEFHFLFLLKVTLILQREAWLWFWKHCEIMIPPPSYLLQARQYENLPILSGLIPHVPSFMDEKLR